jgi:(2Fe-2S) ferredoxin
MSKQRTLLVCTKGKKCPDRGSKQVLRELRDEVERQGVDIEVEKSGCLKLCKFGPSICAMPEEFSYGGVSPEDAKALVQSHARGEKLERLAVKRKKK